MFHFFKLLASVALRIGLGVDAPLPGVDEVLTNAADKMQDFYEHAANMQNQMSKLQEESRTMLTRKKHEYEAALDAQAERIHNLSASNELLHQHNVNQKDMNTRMQNNLTALFNSNKKLHHALQLLGERVAMAQRFVVESLHVTDDADAMELKVLATTSPKPSLALLLDSARDNKKTALLQLLSDPTPKGVPQQYVEGLANSISDMHSAELEAADELKKQFEARMNVGMKRRAELKATQASLAEKRAELHARWDVLLQTQETLESTHRKLNDRLNALQVFSEKLGSLSVRALDVIAGTPAKPAAKVPAAKNAMELEFAKPNVTAPGAVAPKANATAKAPEVNGSGTNHSVKLAQTKRVPNSTSTTAAAAAKANATAKAPEVMGSGTYNSVKLAQTKRVPNSTSTTAAAAAKANATAKAPKVNGSGTKYSVKRLQTKWVPSSPPTTATGFLRKVTAVRRVNDTAPVVKRAVANASGTSSQPLNASGKATAPGRLATGSANVSSSATNKLFSNAISARAESSNGSTKPAGAVAAAKLAVVKALRNQPQISSFTDWLSKLR